MPDSQPDPVDCLVVGGGINGAGIARDAAGRGLAVLLCEKGDLGGATSSASSKLVHGGLRYLERYEFRLVRESLREREVLLRIAPHIVWPLRFALPHSPEQRPFWMIRLGLFLYDRLGGRISLPGCRAVRFADHPTGWPLWPDWRRGFLYSDCWVQDSRLVVLNARDAADRGADIRPRTTLVSARREGAVWVARLRDEGTGAESAVRARALINAAGPWVGEVLAGRLGRNGAGRVRLVKGSHIVTRRLFEHDRAYLLQNTDGRIVFVIPYEGEFTLIGTTDVEVPGDPGREPAISEAETAYLCAAVNRYFAAAIGPEDVVWSYSGLRPLYDDAAADASAVTRDYAFELDAPAGEAPVLSVFGGKLTTYRKLAEHALARLRPATGWPAGTWTADAALPGGDMPGGDVEAYLDRFRAARPWMPPALARRWVRDYGTLAETLAGGATSLADLGPCLGGDLHRAELDYLRTREWARTADDVLWRRGKLGLRLTPDETALVTEAMQGEPADD